MWTQNASRGWHRSPSCARVFAKSPRHSRLGGRRLLDTKCARGLAQKFLARSRIHQIPSQRKVGGDDVFSIQNASRGWHKSLSCARIFANPLVTQSWGDDIFLIQNALRGWHRSPSHSAPFAIPSPRKVGGRRLLNSKHPKGLAQKCIALLPIFLSPHLARVKGRHSPLESERRRLFSKKNN